MPAHWGQVGPLSACPGTSPGGREGMREREKEVGLLSEGLRQTLAKRDNRLRVGKNEGGKRRG